MACFNADSIAFLRELSENNTREWFDANRKRYERELKAPLAEFAAEMIGRMQELDPDISMLPKDAVSRIHRDTRFSKDKTPYKDNVYLVVSSSGKGYHATPGLYFNLGASNVYIASGLYFLEPSQVNSVRQHLIDHRTEFESLVAAPDFVRLFGEVQGAVNKVLAPEFKSQAETFPILFQKQFFYLAKYPSDEVLREDLADWVMEHMRSAWPLNRFFARALQPSTA